MEQQSAEAGEKGSEGPIFKPLWIKKVRFKNRIVRSSIGGRTAYYDGTVDNAWKNFEKKFAENKVAGIISATMTVDEKRWSPLEYPKLSHQRFVEPLKAAIKEIQACDGCKYIIQLGDPGYHTQTSLFPQEEDALSPSSGFDLLYGYRNTRREMTPKQIEQVIQNFVDAAQRVKDTGADGLEITASKGYLIHQFLNPRINRRTDQWGGDIDRRFRFLEEIVCRVHEKIGKDEKFLFGIRLSAEDFNYLPFNLRWPVWPIVRPFRHSRHGNTLKETIYYGQKLKPWIDYLHITSGFGFINPKENPGQFPLKELGMFMNSTRHLSRKAYVRATLLNALPWLVRLLVGRSWKETEGINVNYAAAFKNTVGLHIIANGGLQNKSFIEDVLHAGKCDLVSVARPLLANPKLVKQFQGEEGHSKACTFCNKCAALTTLFPLGCYDRSRFVREDMAGREKQKVLRSRDRIPDMEESILDLSGNPNP